MSNLCTEKESKEQGFISKLAVKLGLKKSQQFIKLQDMSTNSEVSFSVDESDIDSKDGANIVEDEDIEKPPSKWALLKDRGVLIASFLYAVLGFEYVFYEEAMPYWAFLPVADGGILFNSTGL